MTVKVVETINEMKRLRLEMGEPVGFVPTMGYLHEGHLELVRRAKQDSPTVVVSIFVNPTQFGPQEDFKSYPRDLPRDLAMLEGVKTDLVFAPSATEMYPAPFDSWVEVGKVSQRLEGAIRPAHFKGVTTVVAKLFNIVQPTKAYFGQKDAQQVTVIRKMVADLNMNLEVVTVPTVREPDGLAMSSRNTYLQPDERKAAAVLYQALSLAKQFFSDGIWDIQTVRGQMLLLLTKEPLVPLSNIEYVSIANPETLEEQNPLGRINPPALVSLAVRIGKTRLIDNIVLE